MTMTKTARVAIGFGLIAFGLVFAVLPDDWIEAAFGFSPDGGDGLAEAAVAGAPIATGCVLAFDALRAGGRAALRTVRGLGVAARP
jgi:hypothetical protein